MRGPIGGLVCVATTFFLTAACTNSALAQSAEEFFRSHPQITLGVPSGAGGPYDIYTRLLARYLPKYVPGNPTIVVQNITAAGGLALANQTYNTAPKDGTFLAMIRGSTIQDAVNGDSAAKFDGRKFAWIANMNKEYDSCIVPSNSPIQSVGDLYKQELIVGATGAGAQSYTFPLVYNEVLHMKFKVIAGYNTLPDRIIAMDRGELTGNCGLDTGSILSTMPDQYRQGKIRILFQAGLGKDPQFPDVPNVLDEAKTEADRQALDYMFATLELGRPFAAPAETPSDRIAFLRAAFDRTMKDSGLQEEAKKMQLSTDGMNGSETTAAVVDLYGTPRTVIDRVQAVLNAK